MKILLTGGTGFLGSALALHFLKAGNEVALLLRPSSKLDRLQGLEKEFDFRRCATDSDIDTFVQQVRPEVVIHTACLYGRRGETALELADANTRLGLLIMQGLLTAGCPATFINTGTALAPEVNSYALSKHQLSQWGRVLASEPKNQIRFINILLQHMYGPGDDVSKFTTFVLRACQGNQPELKLTSSKQRRDFIYIDDVISAFSTLVMRRLDLEQVLDVEVGSGDAVAVREFVETLHRITGSKTKFLFGAIPDRENEPMLCQADLTYMNNLGWEPMSSLEDGLSQTLKLEFHKEVP